MSRESQLRDVLVCKAVGDVPGLPGSPSFKDTCVQCNTRVWRAYSSPRAEAVICNACFAKAVEASGVIVIEPPSPQQLIEIIQEVYASRN